MVYPSSMFPSTSMVVFSLLVSCISVYSFSIGLWVLCWFFLCWDMRLFLCCTMDSLSRLWVFFLLIVDCSLSFVGSWRLSPDWFSLLGSWVFCWWSWSIFQSCDINFFLMLESLFDSHRAIPWLYNPSQAGLKLRVFPQCEHDFLHHVWTVLSFKRDHDFTLQLWFVGSTQNEQEFVSSVACEVFPTWSWAIVDCVSPNVIVSLCGLCVSPIMIVSLCGLCVSCSVIVSLCGL